MSDDAVSYARNTDGVKAIIAERTRQVCELGYTASHDDEHASGEIAAAAAFYAMTPRLRSDTTYRHLDIKRENMRHSTVYPFNGGWYDKNKFTELISSGSIDSIDDRVAELAAAGALCAAEIDRLLRLRSKL